MYVLLFYQKSSFGEEVEMKVRPGENITLFCDRSLSVGSFIVWIRNCSHENQPSLIIDFRQGFRLGLEAFQRFSFIHNPYNNSHGLHITNISISDLGLYYCAEVENKALHLLTVCSAGCCCSVCVRCVFSSPHSCPPSVFTATVQLRPQVLQRYLQRMLFSGI
ncbi:uncharacterized protein LOC122352717 isoform X2 [Puntigrus tetrazona]|uniref:uncharacterized protein LOC122330624 isoform X2 n=1 Tax=Puntigrus tetrazona TaxID=1606681 RepID=UPI001C89460F|nr:uncharacterized protein LOC122330624 isoform X2 [Puntigrus tetrazona]XP_043106341.1 uncharacterized protein LOC122352717 isoform X2 [Puntigrus tetrazona]